jgi:chemotaxis methyl-accepting protein methylase
MSKTKFDIHRRLENFYALKSNSENNFQQLVDYISKELDLDLSNYRDKYLNRRLYYRIIRVEEVSTYKEYLHYLKTNPEEVHEFKKSLTIHVTHFFRDEKPFRYFEKSILPQLNKIKHEKGEDDTPIRILSAPCSTGEEPYSFAIIADFLKKKNIIDCDVQIDAYDIEPEAIKIARLGVYPVNTLEEVSRACVLRNFRKKVGDFLEIKPCIKKYVNFDIHNLLKPIPGRKEYDLVACRNFLIYINKPKQKRVIDNLTKNLSPHGYLMLGKTEGFPLLNTKKFEPINIREHFYQLKQ